MALLISCASPFLESARDPKGLSGGLGVLGIGAIIPGLDPDQFTDHFEVMSVADVRYGFSGPLSLSVQLGGGYARGRDYLDRFFDPIDSLGIFCASASVSAKFYAGSHSALRLNAGAFGTPPWYRDYVYPLVSLSYLRDFGKSLTFSASIGTPMIVGLGLVYHMHMGRHVVAHVSGGTSTVLSAGLGLGVDYVRNPRN